MCSVTDNQTGLKMQKTIKPPTPALCIAVWRMSFLAESREKPQLGTDAWFTSQQNQLLHEASQWSGPLSYLCNSELMGLRNSDVAACFLSQTPLGCSHATQSHAAHIVPPGSSEEALIPASSDIWIWSWLVLNINAEGSILLSKKWKNVINKYKVQMLCAHPDNSFDFYCCQQGPIYNDSSEGY